MSDSIISKSELARIVKVHRSRINRYAEKGMPLRSDGMVDKARALAWIRKNIRTDAGGWLLRGKPTTTAERAAAAGSVTESQGVPKMQTGSAAGTDESDQAADFLLL